MHLTIDAETHDASALLMLRGDLDLATAPALREALIEVLRGCKSVVVDLEGVGFVDSAGIGILLGGLKRARSQGGELELVCTSRQVLRPLEIIGLDRVFTIHSRRDAALLERPATPG
jgi:anti-sigma B factor antagonist